MEEEQSTKELDVLRVHELRMHASVEQVSHEEIAGQMIHTTAGAPTYIMTSYVRMH